MMKHWVIAGALAAAVFSGGLGLAAYAEPIGKPLLSDMENENDLPVRQVRDALFAFNGANKRWPLDLTALGAFAREKGMPLDLDAFQTARLTVRDEAGASVALFEFVMKGSPVKGAFAISNYVVK